MKKVSLKYCDEYDLKKIKKLLIESIEEMGGLEKYISKGEKVLLKLNLLMAKKPEEAATTHPVFTKALIEILTEYGAKVLIGDSPGGPFSKTMLRMIYKATGIEEIAAQTGAELNFNTGSFEKDNPNGAIYKKITMTDMLNDADKVISVSKLKTHGMMTYTGAVKNMFGTVPGILKGEYHLNLPDYYDFANSLVDICICANPVLSFMDGIVGMEGDGPSAGIPRKLNAILVSDSPYHLDKIGASIISLKFSDVPTIKACIDRGLCKGDLSDIELIGELDNFIVKDFKVSKSAMVNPLQRYLPKFILPYVMKYIQPKPVFEHELCVGCKICADNCPAKIIEMENKKPFVDLDKCIRCFCCQELCPKKAVTIYRSRLLKLATKR